MAWIDISLFLQEADRGENLDNIVRTLSYKKLPEENTEMMKPAENETSKQPQSWAEAAKAAGVLVLTSQGQFDNGNSWIRELPQVNPSHEVPTNQKKRKLLE